MWLVFLDSKFTEIFRKSDANFVIEWIRTIQWLFFMITTTQENIFREANLKRKDNWSINYILNKISLEIVSVRWTYFKRSK